MNQSFFTRSKVFYWAVILVITALGTAIRFYDLNDLPLDFNPTRQLRAAVIARGMYYQHLDSVPQWQKEMAAEAWEAQGLIEPQIMERLAALTYQLTGSESLIIPRAYAILIWLLGAAVLFLLAREIAGADGAVAALLFFLLLPFGAVASRAFMPDPLMVTLIILAWWSLLRWHHKETWFWAILAGMLGGLAIYAKAVAVFFILFPYAGVILARRKFNQTIRDPRVWVMAALTVLPYAVYHFYGAVILHLLQSQFSLRFFPQLWKDPVYYLHWQEMINGTVGFHWVVAALLGTFTIRQKPLRAMLVGAWIGYLAYGLTFSYHIQTHDYYQLPLLPLVGLGLAGAGELIFRSLQGRKILVYPVVTAILLFWAVTAAWSVRVALKAANYRPEMRIWAAAGEALGHEAKVVGLTHDYGYRLLYWGWVNQKSFQTSSDVTYRSLAGQTEGDFEVVFEEATQGMDFFIVTLFGDLEHQPALKSRLYDNYPIYVDAGDYVVFDLRSAR